MTQTQRINSLLKDDAFIQRLYIVDGILKQYGYNSNFIFNTLGNTAFESELDPKAKSPSGEYNGIAQWDPTRFAKGKKLGFNMDKLEDQVKYFIWECQHGPYSKHIKKTVRLFGNNPDKLEYSMNTWEYQDNHQYENSRNIFIGKIKNYLKDHGYKTSNGTTKITNNTSTTNTANATNTTNTTNSNSATNTNSSSADTSVPQINSGTINSNQQVPPAQAVSTNVSTPPVVDLRPIKDAQTANNNQAQIAQQQGEPSMDRGNVYSTVTPTKFFPLNYNKPKFRYDSVTNQYFNTNDNGQIDTSKGTYKPSEDEETNYNKQAQKFGWSTRQQNTFANGGGINIKPSHEGLFSKAAKAHGMSVQQYAASILRNKDNHSATLIKRANFARNAAGWSHAEGGYLNDEDNTPDGGINTGNTNLNNYGYGVTRYAAGGTHEQNRNGGIQQGIAPDGQPNLVEQGEVRYNNYIYSNRLSPNRMRLKRNNLPTNMTNKTYARIAEDLSNEVQERPNDPISLGSLKAFMDRLRKTQDIHKKVKDISLDPDAINAIKRGAINAKGNKYLDI